LDRALTLLQVPRAKLPPFRCPQEEEKKKTSQFAYIYKLGSKGSEQILE
jgi:hypothetical protein